MSEKLSVGKDTAPGVSSDGAKNILQALSGKYQLCLHYQLSSWVISKKPLERYNKIQYAGAYARYLAAGKSRWSVHSPFLYELIEKVIRNKAHDQKLDPLLRWQEQLRGRHERLAWQELGAGKNVRHKRVSRIFRQTIRPFSQYRILSGLVRFSGAREVLELGTGLGLSTLALAAAGDHVRVCSIEGNKALYDFVRIHSTPYHSGNIEFIHGRIGSSLALILPKIAKADLVFMDGNHRYHPSIRYYDLLQPFLHESSLMILDDIHWSQGMEWAWEELSARPEVGLSVDMFHFGLLFFRKDLEKRHFILRY